MMNPHVAMMGNMDLEARIKVDYSTLTYISDKTELETNTKKEDPKENNQNQASNTATENKTETTKDNQQESQAVKQEIKPYHNDECIRYDFIVYVCCFIKKYEA